MRISEKIAEKIVSMIADGRVSLDLVQHVGYWIAQYSAGTESEHKILALAYSIIDSINEANNNREKHDRITYS